MKLRGVRISVLVGLRAPTLEERTRHPIRFWHYGSVRFWAAVVTGTVPFLAAAKYLIWG